ncbi:MAG TPA: hypothetical protein VEX18_00950 [Polyangiaceae bacterium]|nr:hypothetical protein [Polyangiaceae bacterium]
MATPLRFGKYEGIGNDFLMVEADSDRALAPEQAPYDAPITLKLPGGPLELTDPRADLAVTLRGPARHVFSGEVVAP